MSGRTRRKPGPGASAFDASTRRPTLAGAWYLAAATGLISIAKLQPTHGGGKIGFGSSTLRALAQSLVELGFATRADWTDAARVPSTMVDRVLRRFLANNGQALIAEHFELSLMLGEHPKECVSDYKFGLAPYPVSCFLIKCSGGISSGNLSLMSARIFP